MSLERKPVVRCAIYTRKSSEEGLEQSFNSLDAQREACQAYIVSQRHEGWRVLSSRYDDGGYSGGTIERPALKHLLKDVEDGKIDTIVVYKVDRLTRSLADFAKIVEKLDAQGVSFVSVTQQFNTTSSMGRLTLNVLLSFAQFEREVTGERIRDKIAASKRKGIWMGGNIPLGYDLKDRKLLVNQEGAKLVGHIFSGYLAEGCVSKLKARLDREGVKSKVRVSVSGARSGGSPYSRGALYHILNRRIYLGEIPHRGLIHPGEHEAIVPRELWERVQAQLKKDNQGRRQGLKSETSSQLVGLLQDAEGRSFTPSHTAKNGRRYRYYICRAVNADPSHSRPIRLPAFEIETHVVTRIGRFLESEQDVIDNLGEEHDEPVLTRRLVSAAQSLAGSWKNKARPAIYESVRKFLRLILIHEDRAEIRLSKRKVRALLLKNNNEETTPASHKCKNEGELQTAKASGDTFVKLEIEMKLKRCGLEMRLIIPPRPHDPTPVEQRPSLLKAIARAHDWHERIIHGNANDHVSLAKQTGLGERYVGRILEYAFLAPDIVEAILDGRQPQGLTLQRFQRKLPMNWAEQRKLLGFPAAPNGLGTRIPCNDKPA